MSFLGQGFVSACETISVANYLLYRLIKQSNTLLFLSSNNSNTANWTNLSSCDVRLLMPPYMSFSVCMNWGSFQGHKSSFWTFLPCLVPHAFIRANVSFSLKWSQIDLDGQFRLFDSDLQWHCRVFGVCCAGVLPAKQITRHDSSLLYSAELLFVVVVVCFFVEAEKGTFVVQLVTCMQHSRFPPICFQTCKLRSTSVWVYGNELQKHSAFVFTHTFPKLK